MKYASNKILETFAHLKPDKSFSEKPKSIDNISISYLPYQTGHPLVQNPNQGMSFILLFFVLIYCPDAAFPSFP